MINIESSSYLFEWVIFWQFYNCEFIQHKTFSQHLWPILFTFYLKQLEIINYIDKKVVIFRIHFKLMYNEIKISVLRRPQQDESTSQSHERSFPKRGAKNHRSYCETGLVRRCILRGNSLPSKVRWMFWLKLEPIDILDYKYINKYINKYWNKIGIDVLHIHHCPCWVW